MNVRAKFNCHSVKKTYTTKWEDGKPVMGFLYDYEFYVVTNDNNDENKVFFASTPSGKINVQAVRDDLFEPGRNYYTDFSPAEE